MASIEILSPVMINGEPVPAGSLVDIADGDALYLIGNGIAAPAATPEPEPEPEPKSARPRKHASED